MNEWFRLEPYKHQVKAFKLAIKHDSFAFLMDMGTGKSACIIAACSYWADMYEATNIVIVIPKTAVAAWRNQLNIHSVLQYTFIDLTVGSKAKKAERLLQVKKDRPNYAIINYDSLCSLEPYLKEWAHTIVLDESHKIKSYKAKRSRAAHRLGKNVSFRLIATGTLMETPLDVWSQYAFVEPTLMPRSFYAYRQEYVKYNKWTMRVDGFKNRKRLERIIYSRGFRVTKEECLDLPAKQDIIYPFELTGQHATYYKQMKEEALLIIGQKTVSAPIILTQYLKLQQITSGFIVDEDKKAETVGNCKLEALADILEELVHKKIVIFCRFKWEFEAISALARKESRRPVIISGDTKDRGDKIHDFRKTDTYDTIIIQIDVGSTAIELFESHTVIYYSTTFSFINYHQSRDRVHRIGQTEKVTYIHLHAKGTIDTLIHDTISGKKDVASNLMKIFERMKKDD